MKTIENLQWRYATKQFDPSKKVSASDLELLKQSIQLSASSFGLQLYKVLIVETQSIKDQLKTASWNQAQLSDASHVVIFCNYHKPNDQFVDEYIANKAKIQGLKIQDIAGYGDFMKGAINGRSAEDFEIWTAKQTYIALGTLLAAAAELKIDACPMEGFDPKAYNDILGLNEKGLNAAVIAPIGYRSDSDATQHQKKVRKPLTQLFQSV